MNDPTKRIRVPLAIWVMQCFVFCGLGCVPEVENEVVVYTAVDREYAAVIFDGFERQYEDMLVSRQFDVESTKTLGLVTRLEEEKNRPLCDVFWNNEVLHTIRLQQKGILKRRRWNIPDSWPAGFRGKDGSWVGFAARGRILLVNKENLPDRESWPTSVSQLADSQFENRCGMAFPIYGTTATHMAVLKANNGEAFDDWIQSVQNNAVVLSGNKQVALAVSNGELDWGLTDTDDAIIEIEKGAPVEIIFPDQLPDQPGMLFIPNTVAVLENSPHPVAAEQMADYLINQETESRLAMGNSAQFPVWPEAEVRSRIEPEEPLRWMDVDFESAAAQWDNLSTMLRSTFSSN